MYGTRMRRFLRRQRAAFRALVRAAFLAAAERSSALRLPEAALVWRDNARFDAAAFPSRLSAFFTAFERAAEGAFFSAASPAFKSGIAFRRVSALAFPFSGGGRSTPARRALDKPIAIACLADLAPCLPSRIGSISSRTNSPACVLGALPSRLSCLARSRVFFSGIAIPPFGERAQRRGWIPRRLDPLPEATLQHLSRNSWLPPAREH
jgi:hypothetical protein